MSKSKKMLMLIFTITLVVNLQLTGNLTSGMDNGFSLEQLADNIFAPSAYAEESLWWEGNVVILLGGGYDCITVEEPYNCIKI